MARWWTGRTPYLTCAAAGAGLVGMLAVNTVFAPANHPTGRPEPYESASQAPASASAPASAPSDAPTPTPGAETQEATPTASAKPTATARAKLPHQVVYVGTTRRGGLSVAVAVYGDEAAAYVCDGEAVEAWFTGRAGEDRVRLHGPDGARIRARLEGRRLAGSLRVADERASFRIARAQRPAGLYRARSADGKVTVGWIVLPSGRQVGLADDAGKVKPAPRLVPGQPVVLGGQRVTPQEVEGHDDV